MIETGRVAAEEGSRNYQEEITSTVLKYSSQSDLHGTGSRKVTSYGVVILCEPDNVSPRSCLCGTCRPVLVQKGSE